MDKLTNQYIIESLSEKFGEAVQIIGEPHGLLTLSTSAEQIIEVLTYLKNSESLRFNYLTDITGVHYPNQEKEFAVVYHLHNLFRNLRVRIKVFLDGTDLTISTVTNLWKGANWMERETYDFYGIIFDGHPDLRRILNMDDLEVFPMRKEHPLEDPNRVDKKDFYFGR
ncbi:NADH-quinone oxidoreductase subunit C [Sphingobacterium litopenaei]|uniref:NADH-quinone oxidoreductase subunit C n=1 Tax=Sphingobacterium litopenaei TaxID=2763500 RepID=A0ABR7YD95_9SPHI|nr:NADH-quinone oxidoreductase subunit C [Sphingobacterium litopenaei]MBD1429285.1 NADH-quinone oxidoreductase subunit C [Sphingobacterium litopenaei]